MTVDAVPPLSGEARSLLSQFQERPGRRLLLVRRGCWRFPLGLGDFGDLHRQVAVDALVAHGLIVVVWSNRKWAILSPEGRNGGEK